MDNFQEFRFNNIYKQIDIIDNYVKSGCDFWNYNEEIFINASAKFSKQTLLHLYIITTLINHYHKDFIKNGDLIDEDMIEDWYSLFDSYEIKICKAEININTDIAKWFETNLHEFEELFRKMSDEIFYVLFSNREFLLAFNNLTTRTVIETTYPNDYLSAKGRIKRVIIPKWVRNAVYHREKGRCVFCNTDLTGLINTLTNSNYDHMVPLDLYGTNDPCNIQLTCEKCNKSKTNKDGVTSRYYANWWAR